AAGVASRAAVAIPDYQTLMLPPLRIPENQKERAVGDAVATLSDDLRLSNDERRQVQSGVCTMNNRVAWSPALFEELVVRLLVSIGYGGSIADAGQAVEGAVAGSTESSRRTPLGLDAIYVKARRWENTVGRPDI